MNMDKNEKSWTYQMLTEKCVNNFNEDLMFSISSL